MLNKNLIGRCGLYCGTCRIYRAYMDSEKLQKEFAKEFKCSPEEVFCEGCQKLDDRGWDKEKYWGSNCKIVKCLNKKRLDFCYECNEYDTCKKFDKFHSICLKIGINLRDNLVMIKNGNIDEWMELEIERWKCPNCGKPISVDLKNCHWCGNKLRD
ncbi:MAG: DUF3795 domain-containing protein [Thermoplasmata archaeon]|nr:MAG: DUF3795 domain-containing protein [Thermoplasmata archaeon]